MTSVSITSQTRCVQSCNFPGIGKLIFHLSSHKVNGCLAGYSRRATTNNQATNWALEWAKNANIWPKMPVLGQIWPVLGPKSNFLGAGSKNFGTLISGNQWDTFFCIENIDRWGSNWPLRAKMCFFYPKIWIFGAKSQFFVQWSQFLLMEQMTTIPGATTFPSEPPQKKFPFPS